VTLLLLALSVVDGTALENESPKIGPKQMSLERGRDTASRNAKPAEM